MNVDDLLQYFGLPVTNREFHEFLSRNEIREQPDYDPESGIPFALLELPEVGLSMEFIKPDEYAEDFGPVRENGEMIFSKIFIHLVPEDDYKGYMGVLASVLPDPLLPDSCHAKFGKPDLVRDENDDFGQANNIEYKWKSINGYSIFVRFIKAPLAVRHVVITPARI
jgi:hypothetical protein